MPGRTNPRSSRLLTGGAAQTVSLPALIAGLPASSAMVCVGPPLLARPAGASCGWVLPQLVSAVLVRELARQERVAGPVVVVAPPPAGAAVPERVQLLTVGGKRLPLEVVPAGLPEKLLLGPLVVPKSARRMAPPLAALLP